MESNRVALSKMIVDLNVLVFPTDIGQISREYCEGLITLVHCLDKINNILTLNELDNEIIGNIGFLYLKADLILTNVKNLTLYPGSLRKIPIINESVVGGIMNFGKTIDSAFDIGHLSCNWYSRDKLKLLNTLLLHSEFNPTILDDRDTPWNLVLGQNVLCCTRYMDQDFHYDYQYVTEFILSLSSAISYVKDAIFVLPTALGYLSNNTEYTSLNNTLIPVSSIIKKWELKNERS